MPSKGLRFPFKINVNCFSESGIWALRTPAKMSRARLLPPTPRNAGGNFLLSLGLAPEADKEPCWAGAGGAGTELEPSGVLTLQECPLSWGGTSGSPAVHSCSCKRTPELHSELAGTRARCHCPLQEHSLTWPWCSSGLGRSSLP